MKTTSSPSEPLFQLREERQRRGWTQQDLADLLHTTPLTISRWERGEMSPGPYFRQKLSQIFGKHLHDLGLSTERQPALPDQPDDTALFDTALPFPRHRSQALIGRDELLAQLVQALCHDTSGISLAVTGLPGVGKTALIVALAHHPHIRHYFHDGILWVGLGPHPQTIELLGRWGHLFALTPTEMNALTTYDAWARYLHDRIGARRMLLIIDDAWDVTDAFAFRIGGQHCAHVLTTRFPTIALSFAREQVYHVPELSKEQSLALFQQLVPQAVTQFPDEVSELAQAVGGLPLALTLIGRHLSVQAYGGQLRRMKMVLHRLLADVKQRLQIAEHQVPWEQAPTWPMGTALSLQATISISDHALPEEAQCALRCLAIFPSKPHSFSEEAAMAVCRMPVEVLDLLIDSGLMEIQQPGRYYLHQTITDYAALQEIDPQTELHFIQYVVTFILSHQEDDAALEQDMPVITKALDLAFERGMRSEFAQGVLALAPFLEQRRLYPLATHLLQRTQQAASELRDQDGELRSWLHLGKMAELQCNYDHAEQAYQRGLSLARAMQHPLQARLLLFLSIIKSELGDYTATQLYLEEAFEVACKHQDLDLQAEILQQLGENADTFGESQQANSFYEQGLALARQTQNWTIASALLQNLGVKAARRGDYQQATALYEEGLAYAMLVKDLRRQCAILMNLGMLAYHQSDYALAVERSLEGLRLARSIDYRQRISAILQNLGLFECLEGNYAQAEIYLQESLQVAQDIGHGWLINEAQVVWGMLYLHRQQYAQAKELFEQILVKVQAMEATMLIAQTLFGLAQAEMALEGDRAKAYSYAQESLALFETLQDSQGRDVERWLAEHC